VGLLLLSSVLVLLGCTDTRGSSSSFSGACFGEPYPVFSLCGELFNDDGPAYCNLHMGCEWRDCDGTCGFCGGDYYGCRGHEAATGCERRPGCSWWAPPTCETWRECAILWLESGGCEEARNA